MICPTCKREIMVNPRCYCCGRALDTELLQGCRMIGLRDVVCGECNGGGFAITPVAKALLDQIHKHMGMQKHE